VAFLFLVQKSKVFLVQKSKSKTKFRGLNKKQELRLELDINAFCSTLNAKQDSSAVQINGTSRN
jgi:hypothetical protein